jgi:hypothetical protein
MFGTVLQANHRHVQQAKLCSEGETVEATVVAKKEERIILRPDEGMTNRKRQVALPAHFFGGGMAQADPFPGPHEEGLVALAFREEGIRHLALERGKVLCRVENPHRFRLGTIEAENDVVARRREKDEGDVSKKEARTRDRWIGKLGERTEGQIGRASCRERV